jgi:hypothetical protein
MQNLHLLHDMRYYDQKLRKCYPLPALYRVKFDRAFRCTRSNVELKSTRYFPVFYVGLTHSPVIYWQILNFED